MTRFSSNEVISQLFIREAQCKVINHVTSQNMLQPIKTHNKQTKIRKVV